MGRKERISQTLRKKMIAIVKENNVIKKIFYFLESIPIFLFYFLSLVMPPSLASSMGGKFLSLIGPKLKKNQIAKKNLKKVFPEKNNEEIETIISGMWENLGRVAAEYPHLKKFNLYSGGRLKSLNVRVVGKRYIEQLRDDRRPGIFFSAHLGNWEINAKSAVQRGLPLTLIYRKPNNPFSDFLVKRARSHITNSFAAKGKEGARKAIKVLSKGGHLAMLVDQKMNDGISIPFFGVNAMTAPAIAELAIKFNCPIVPARVKRIKGTKFEIKLYPPIKIPTSSNKKEKIYKIMVQVNEIIEDWIREAPEQWLWVHDRWP